MIKKQNQAINFCTLSSKQYCTSTSQLHALFKQCKINNYTIAGKLQHIIPAIPINKLAMGITTICTCTQMRDVISAKKHFPELL